ncbi:type II toxin-antitoxin system VapB family antitoxin [Thiofilum flexile]|uniref:type II toxin-antitoxin system VapB family antitoxin n=1 Tax=Thiofilum flexile TaxID=125627 RepID=UPI00036120F0|nr:type II toxin-antitoxin system VapB family antitoxin [Thiofilum flexile]
MSNVQTTLFKSNRSQAVRLPKSVELPSEVQQVRIVALGRQRIITPLHESWDDWFDHPHCTADFMDERLQPNDQIRELL